MHEQIAARFENCRFYLNPVDLMGDETFISQEAVEMSDKETFKSSYEATSEAIKTMNQKNADSIEAALRTLTETDSSKKNADVSERLLSALLCFNLLTDSIVRNADFVFQNQTGALRLLDKAKAASRADQIGRIHSALDDVGYDEADKEDIVDDAE